VKACGELCRYKERERDYLEGGKVAAETAALASGRQVSGTNRPEQVAEKNVGATRAPFLRFAGNGDFCGAEFAVVSSRVGWGLTANWNPGDPTKPKGEARRLGESRERKEGGRKQPTVSGDCVLPVWDSMVSFRFASVNPFG